VSAAGIQWRDHGALACSPAARACFEE